jgi:co-chaperonin GroES (HSP10)
MNLISYNNYLLVDPIEEVDETTSAGIILPSKGIENDEQIAVGRVVIGTNKVKTGKIVYFNKLIPSDITIKLEGDKDAKKRFALQESDLMFGQND